jgi:hypothetical protein
MKLLAGFKKPFQYPLSETLQRRFDPENAYRKPTLILNIVPEVSYDMYEYTGEIRPIAEKH